MLFEGLPVSDKKLELLKKETENDQTLKLLKDFTLNGWPANKFAIPADVKSFYPLRSEITVANDLLFKSDHIIVPSSMRKEIKQRIHEGHLGQEQCKSRARQVVYWPGINAEISDMVSKCSTCLEHRSLQQNESLFPHEVPRNPWEKVGADLFEFRKSHYLVIVDYYSNYPEVCFMGKQDPSSSQVIAHLKSVFARHGIPKTLVSDNGPQFASEKFRQFLKDWEIQYDPASPRYPKANGMAESAVKSVKSLFKKAHKANEDPYLALLNHRATPNNTDGLSPAKKLMNRELNTRLSNIKQSVNTTSNKEISMKLQLKKEKQKEIYNRKAKDLPIIPTGATVRIHDGKTWHEKALVNGKSRMPRSYNIKTESGRILRRNRQHLLLSKEPFKPTIEVDDDITPANISSGYHDKPQEENPTTSVDQSTSCSYSSHLRSNSKPPKRFGFT